MSRETTEIEAIYQTATERAVCIREVEDSPDMWLPITEIEVATKSGREPKRGDVVTITGPEWLFEDRGLL